jgi:UDP-N-acetylmuramoylalanine--D-glutamate ligase
MDSTVLKLAGAHNVDNVMAAAAASLALGRDRADVALKASSFEGLEHRCEPAGAVRGVEFFNDSKATNPHATLHAVRSFDRPFVAIMGGRNKGLDFSELAVALCERLDDGTMIGLVLMGESAPEIADAVLEVCPEKANGRMVRTADMDESVSKAFQMASPEASVLFTPACASFDMYEDYQDRGRSFKASVGRLAGGGSDARIE